MDEYLSIINQLFTKQQQTALITITVGVISLTQVFKHVYFGFFPERRQGRKAAIIWLAAFIFGLSGGIIGYYVGIPKQPLWFWIFTGISSGALSIGVFKLIIGIIWPRLINMVKKPS